MSATPPSAPPAPAPGDAQLQRANSEHSAATRSDDKARPVLPREIGGRDGPEPTRFGDWEKGGRCIDF